MRILILSSWLFLPRFCGTRRVVFNSATGLARLGQDVVLLAAVGDQSLPIVKDFTFASVNLNERLLRVYCALENISVSAEFLLPHWSPLAILCRAKVVEWSLATRLPALIANIRPDIVMAEDLYIARIAARSAAVAGVAFAIRLHHIHSVQYSDRRHAAALVRRWESDALKRASGLIAITKKDRELLKQEYGTPTEYAPVGLEPMLAGGVERPGRLAEGYILYVSSYLGEEFRSLTRLAAAFPDSQIAFAGRGSESSRSLPDNVIRFGPVPEKDLATLYRHCRFVFFPMPWTAGQGFPIKLGEAYKSNKPILMNSQAAWLLPKDSAAVFPFVNEEDLVRAARSIFWRPVEQLRRDPGFLDCSVSSMELLRALKNFAERATDPDV